ncbi:hypothetical protein BN1356_00241 [Streptococcus varani]|uniref:Uncharacterized protein n=1 Tax=Streptococcus varani TaxID=1608583 RepID=A0A0E4H395_9STRE|nr:hypothetical protein BN1356_00241 [Streptococcus varani]
MRRYNIVYLLTLVLLPILQQLFDKGIYPWEW